MKQGKKCKDCVYYPKNCGYWDEKFRKKHLQASFINKVTFHNCPDFEKGET